MNKDTLSKLGIIAMIALVAVLILRENSRRSEIEKDGGTTICKLTLCERRGKGSVAFVKYYINGKKYRTSAGGCPDGGGNKVNRYFSMKYDEENPNDIVVDFSSEIHDSILIRELEEKIKFSMYD